MKKTITLPKRNNATSGMKAHNDNQAYKVGRIRQGSWATRCLKATDIIVYDSELVHIYKYHGKQLDSLGMKAFDYVQFVVAHFRRVYRGSGNSFILVVPRQRISSSAAIELYLESVEGKEVYKIKTANPIETSRLSSKELLCANDR